MVAAIDWVVQHRDDDGLNIRVLNLSFGTDGAQDYLLDPLTYAVDVAWRKGIVVVVAAGNRGPEAPGWTTRPTTRASWPSGPATRRPPPAKGASSPRGRRRGWACGPA